MKYLLLDTNHLDVLIYEHERREKLVARLERATEYEVATTIINVQEKFAGWLSIVNNNNTPISEQVVCYASMIELVETFTEIPILPFDEEAANKFEDLTKLGIRNKPKDKKMAAIALCYDSIVLTANIQDFERIPNLKVQNWITDDPVEECTW